MYSYLIIPNKIIAFNCYLLKMFTHTIEHLLLLPLFDLCYVAFEIK